MVLLGLLYTANDSVRLQPGDSDDPFRTRWTVTSWLSGYRQHPSVRVVGRFSARSAAGTMTSSCGDWVLPAKYIRVWPNPTSTSSVPSLVNETRNCGGDDVEVCRMVVAANDNRRLNGVRWFVAAGLVDCVGDSREPLAKQPAKTAQREAPAAWRTFRRVRGTVAWAEFRIVTDWYGFSGSGESSRTVDPRAHDPDDLRRAVETTVGPYLVENPRWTDPRTHP